MAPGTGNTSGSKLRTSEELTSRGEGERREADGDRERGKRKEHTSRSPIFGVLSPSFPPRRWWGEERVIRWSRAGQEEDVVTADLSPEVTLSSSQLLLGWKAESFLKGTMF